MTCHETKSAIYDLMNLLWAPSSCYRRVCTVSLRGRSGCARCRLVYSVSLRWSMNGVGHMEGIVAGAKGGPN